MKDDRGFTLVELLAVICILGIIATIGVYVNMTVIEGAKTKSYEVTKNNILNGANSLIKEGNYSFLGEDNGTKYQCITVNDLIENGYLDKNIINSKISSSSYVSKDTYIYIEKNNDTKIISSEIVMDSSIDNLCSNITIYNISFNGDSEWSQEKNIGIKYKVNNSLNLNKLKYMYEFGDSKNTYEFDSSTINKTININKNGTIYAKIINDSGQVLYSKTYDVSKIDRINPGISTLSGDSELSTSKSVNVTIYDNESGIDTSNTSISYGWSTNTSEPSSYTNVSDISYNDDKTNGTFNVNSSLVGEQYLFIKYSIKDKAGNIVNNTIRSSNTYKFYELYTLTFDANGGYTSISSIQVNYNYPYGTLPVPTRRGYTLDGWYNSLSGGSLVSSSTLMGRGDRTIYARWDINTYNCSAGKYLAKDTLGCTTCPVGSYCEGGTYSYNASSSQGISACPSGYTSIAGTDSIGDCYVYVPAGKYKKNSTSSEILNCTAGTYKSEGKSSYYGDSDSCTECDTGYESSEGASSCTPKTYTITFNAPSGGTVSPSTKSVQYGSAIGDLPVPVKRGYSFDKWVRSSDSTTINSSDIMGAFDIVAIARMRVNGWTCAKGKYLAKDSLGCTTCPSGYYCEGGSYAYNEDSDQGIASCPSDYKSNSGAESINDCYISVDAGYYKTSATGTATSKCGYAKYSEEHVSFYNSSDSCTDCPPGYRTSDSLNVLSTNISSCYIEVGAGYYKKSATDSTITFCSSGTYSVLHYSAYNEEDSDSCKSCPAGTKSNVSRNGCDKCSAGTYSEGGTDTCTPCPTGKTSSEGASECTPISVSCSSGKYLPGNSTSCEDCPNGSYCPGGTYTYSSSDNGINSCPEGYNNSASRKSIYSCYMTVSDGYHKTGKTDTTTEICPTGTYKKSHNGYYGSTTNCQSCSAGTFSSSSGASECTPCPTGKTSSEGASSCSYITTYCGSGYYLPKGSVSCDVCTAGYYCPGGTYTYSSSVTSGRYVCVKGKYSSSGASNCETCPSGTTTAKAYSTSIDDCN